MALKDTTKKIQEAVGATADGVYGRNTALKIIGKLGFTKEEAKEQFGFLMDAFEYGAPPHRDEQNRSYKKRIN